MKKILKHFYHFNKLFILLKFITNELKLIIWENKISPRQIGSTTRSDSAFGGTQIGKVRIVRTTGL